MATRIMPVTATRGVSLEPLQAFRLSLIPHTPSGDEPHGRSAQSQ